MKTRPRGATLIELLTALLVLAILVGIAVPSFGTFAADSHTSSATSDLVTALNVARSEALRRSSPVVACASDDQASCSRQTNWARGWIVFADPNGNGVVDANELIQAWSGPSPQIETTSTADRAVYTSQGMARLPAGFASVAFNVKKTGCSGAHARRVVLSLTGSLQTDKVDCAWTP